MTESSQHSGETPPKDEVMEVLLFAAARTAAGAETVQITLPSCSTVTEFRTALADQVPVLKPLISNLLVAVDETYVSNDDVIAAGSVVACFPPVSGG